jgi:hypothetical protein
MEKAALVVPGRFNGPPGTANGGYIAGRTAAHLDGAGPVQVTLREPPPLEVPLDLAAEEGGRVVASFGGAVIVVAEPGRFEVDAVPPVTFEVAAAAETRYAGLSGHPFPGCFVCGPDRPAGDGLGLRPGRVGDQPEDAVATTWVPDPSLAVDGRIGGELVWAALDCPGGWSSDLVARPMVLGRITAAVHASPEVGDRCVVVGRVLGGDRRKTFTASTAYDSDGRVLGHAEATWIAV